MSTGKLKLFSERLSDRLRALRLKQKDVAEAIGVKPPSVTDYLKGKYFPSREASPKLAALLGVDEQWLLGNSDEPNLIGNARELPRLFKVPWVSWATAGKGRDYQDIAAQLEAEIESDCSNPNAFAIAVDGTSMAPRFQPGEKIVANPGVEPQEGKPVFVKLKDGRIFFKLYHEHGPNAVRLESANVATDASGKRFWEDIIFQRDEIAWIYPAWGRIERF